MKEPIGKNNFKKLIKIINFIMIFILLNRHKDRYGHINYFSQQQNDIKPWMRRMVTTWMLEVSSTLIWPYFGHFWPL